MKVKVTPRVSRVLTQDSPCFEALQQRRLFALMEIESKIAGCQKIVGEGWLDRVTLLIGFDSNQTHNGL